MAIRARNTQGKTIPVAPVPAPKVVQRPLEEAPPKPKKPLKYFLSLLK